MQARAALEEVGEEWNRVFARLDLAQWSPAEDVVRFVARHLLRRLGPTRTEWRRPVEAVLDLGCGVGRHVVWLARLGVPVQGLDVSETALAACREWLDGEGLRARLERGGVDALPFAPEAFDVVVCHGVLDQVRVAVARRALAEVRRVLRPGGLLHLNVRGRDSYDWGRGEAVEPGTFLLAEGPEQGLPQHFFEEAELEALLGEHGFRILDWEACVRHLERGSRARDTRIAVSALRP